jgi:hypothetical protein
VGQIPACFRIAGRQHLDVLRGQRSLNYIPATGVPRDSHNSWYCIHFISIGASQPLL